MLGEQSKMEKHRKVLDGCVREVLNKKRATNSTLLDMLVANEELTYEQVSATVVAFIVLGFDRLSIATCLALRELSRDKKLVEQFQKTDSIESMKPLESFLSECHRLHPTTPIISKHITKGVPLDRFFIPPDTSCLLFDTGRDQQRFKDADNFDVNQNLSNRMNVPMMLTAAVISSLVRKYKLMTDKVGGGLALRLEKEKMRT